MAAMPQIPGNEVLNPAVEARTGREGRHREAG
jgi:hypothetical protein